MSQVVTNLKKRYFLFISVLTLLLFAIVFLPMRYQLKMQALENYALLAESKKQTIGELIASCLTKANSLSSRTVIKEYILSYQNGEMDWSELRLLTYPKYGDGVAVIQNLFVAVRYVDDQPLVVYQKEEGDIAAYQSLFKRTHDTQYTFVAHSDSIQVVVYSPILSGDRLVGSDILAVDISQPLQDLSQDGFRLEIQKQDELLLRTIEPNKIYENRLIDESSCVCIAKPIHEEYFLLICKSTNDVFQRINHVSALSILGFLLGLTMIFIVLYSSLVKLADDMISDAENSRDAYMRFANFDWLTGANTRFFFDNWINAKKSDETAQYVVAMVDINHFKDINDTHGHKTGDDVLKFIASCILSKLREQDIFVRFGGDEFIIVFEGLLANYVVSTFDEIDKKIDIENTFGFDISISYGVEETKSLKSIYEVIKKADEKMYAHKNQLHAHNFACKKRHQ